MKKNSDIDFLCDENFNKQMLESIFLCPICKTGNSSVAVAEAFDNLYYCSNLAWQYNRCLRCQSLYLLNRPKMEFIHLAYKSYYTHEKSRGLLSSFIRKLKQSYVRSSLNNSYLIYFFKLLGPIKSFLDAKTRGLAYLKPGNVFDFGFGNGAFLALCRDNGWTIKGCDFDVSAVLAATELGLDVTLGGIEILAQQADDSFDFITLSHVIEHVNNPNELFELCWKKLNKNGVLWIETPNANSMGLKIFGANWRGLEPPRHLILFSIDSLIDSLKIANFKEIIKDNHFLASCFMYVASAKLSNSSISTYNIVVRCIYGLLQDFNVIYKNADSEFLTIRCKK